MALSRILLESGDRLLTEDGASFVTEDSVDERSASLAATLGAIASTGTGALAIGGMTVAPIGTFALAASSGLRVAGSFGQSIGEMLLSAAGALQQQGAGVVIVTLDPITASGAGALAIGGALSSGIGGIGLAAAGETTLPEGTGSLSINIEPITIVSGGVLDIAGSVDASIGAITLAAAGTGPGGREAALTASIGQIVLASSGQLGEQPEDIMQPVTLAEAKRHLRLEAEDTADDALVTTLIAAAAAQIEAVTGVVCVSRTVTFSFQAFGAYVALPLVPVDLATIAISYLDSEGASQPLAGFRAVTMAGLARIYPPADGWPSMAAATITATVGYPAGGAPGNVKAAALLLVGHWYANREAVTVGDVANDVPMSAQWLLDTISVRRA